MLYTRVCIEQRGRVPSDGKSFRVDQMARQLTQRDDNDGTWRKIPTTKKIATAEHRQKRK